jgi:hypothetical protein
MSRHRLAWIVVLAGVFCSSTLLTQTAQAQGVWVGSATCTAKTIGPNGPSGPYGYSEQQTQKWKIVPGQVNAFAGFKQYFYNWTVTGGGANSSYTWNINGHAKGGYFQTYLDSTGKLHIQQTPSGGDLRGILLTPRGGGTPFSWNIWELELFPIMIVPGKASSIHGTSKTNPMNVGFERPANSRTIQQCSWSFRLI